jgi:predicted TIM-barrel fold metal-dependent hydrolase
MSEITPRDAALLQLPSLQPTAAWLAASVEEILEPELPIIDCHHHLSEHWGGYLLPELLSDTGCGHAIEATVYIQCGWHYRLTGTESLQAVGETEAVVALAEMAANRNAATHIAAGIVGYADLRLGEQVDEVIDAHIEASKGRLRGIRNSAARHPEFKHGVLPRPQSQLYADASFRRGYARLEQYGLSFDTWIYHTQLAEVIELAAAFPHVPLILDHVGGLLGAGPYKGRRADAMREWLPLMRQLAEYPNVTVKLGGLGTTVCGFDFCLRPTPPSSQELADAWRPIFDPVIELFGPQRCMFESNFPVDRAAASYGVVWNAFKRLAAGASAEHKALLFHDTAARVYRL